MKKKIFKIIICLTIIFFSCQQTAPRENPFDPKSSIYNPNGGLKGFVLNHAEKPIPSAVIQSCTGGYSTTSQDDGSYEIKNIKNGVYDFVISKSGYYDEITTIEIPQNTTVEQDLYVGFTPPVLLSPTNNSNPIYSDPATYLTIDFQWEKVIGAEKYEIAIDTDNDMVFDLIKTVSTESFSHNFTVSTNNWKVRAIKEDTKGPWSETWQVSVGYQSV